MKKKIIYLSIILVLVISVITLSSIYKSKDNKYKKEYNTIPKEMAIMIKEEGATDYTKSASKDIPKGNYTLNEEKTHCENNGKVTNYNSATGTVSINFIGSDKCYLYFDYKTVYGYETILLNNGNGASTVEDAKSYIEGKGTPDFTTTATTNEGMYAADDDLGTSYYFRGAVDNNWVKFGKDSSNNDIYWRIIRINGDDSIRMIYTGITAPTESTKVVMTGTGTQIRSNYSFNSDFESSEYVGYMYTIGEQHGNSNDSTIKTFIDNWYKTTTLETDTSAKNLVADQIFCNDREVTSGTWSSTGSKFDYAPYTRVYANSSESNPILKCTNVKDKFTVNENNGNGALTYPVGLITIDEINLAGAISKYDSNNNNFYLYTNTYYWTGSPCIWNDYAQSFSMSMGGFIYVNMVYNYYDVRPVVSISKEAKLSGDGTWNNVYTVS